MIGFYRLHAHLTKSTGGSDELDTVELESPKSYTRYIVAPVISLSFSCLLFSSMFALTEEATITINGQAIKNWDVFLFILSHIVLPLVLSTLIFSVAVNWFRRIRYMQQFRRKAINWSLDTSEKKKSEDVNQEMGIYIQNILATRFDLEELKTLCFHLGVNFDNLRGEGLAGKARELVMFCRRRQQIGKLVQKIKHIRPDIDLNSC